MSLFGNPGDFEAWLGSETDDGLIRRLLSELKSRGALPTGDDSYLAGSQYIRVLGFTIEGAELTVVIETYAGVRLRGREVLVQTIAARVVPAPTA